MANFGNGGRVGCNECGRVTGKLFGNLDTDPFEGSYGEILCEKCLKEKKKDYLKY